MLASTFWLDVLKTLIGAAVGAGLAFGFALLQQRRTRRNAQLAAGNLGLLTVWRQHSDAAIVARGLQDERKSALLKRGEAQPLWAQSKPAHFYFSESLKIDFQGLAFLFEQGRSDVFEKLVRADVEYHDLALLIDGHAAALERLQRRLVEVGVTPGNPFDVEKVEIAIGADIIAKANSYVAWAFDRSERIDQPFKEAYSSLRSALVAEFGEARVVSHKLESPGDLVRKQTPVTDMLQHNR